MKMKMMMKMMMMMMMMNMNDDDDDDGFWCPALFAIFQLERLEVSESQAEVEQSKHGRSFTHFSQAYKNQKVTVEREGPKTCSVYG